MRKLITIVLFLIGVIHTMSAQGWEIKGSVQAARTNEALEYVHVILLSPDSTFLKGSMTDQSGNYEVSKIETGNYILQVSCLGYKSAFLSVNDLTGNRKLETVFLQEDAIALENITVTASNQTSKSDRKLVFPSEKQVAASSNGVNLLQQLMLPRVQVNPLFNELSLPGGGELQLRINGVKVELQDIVALLPADIIRIEYHDNPGLRYGNAEVVLDYIVYRPETGGSFSIDLNDAVATAWGNNQVSGRLNHKKSEFALNYGFFHRDFYTMYRDNDEYFAFEDGTTLHRREEGEPGHGEMYWQNLNATYSLMPSSESMLSATIRYYGNNAPHWDYKGNLYNVDNPADRVYMIDRSANTTHRPALDLYYQQGLENDQTIVFNLVGTYNYTDGTRIYNESRAGTVLTDVYNLVEGNKYSVIGEGIYEKKLGDNRLSAGIRHSHHFSDNTYKNGADYTTEMKQAETFAYAEFNGKTGKLDYRLGVGLTRDWYKQEGEGDGYTNYTVNPRLTLHYNLAPASFIRLQGEAGNHSPSLSELSAVEQVIDSIQIQKGNPNLNPYNRYSAMLTYELQRGPLFLSWWNLYEYRPKAIMDEKLRDNNRIIQTWNNQKSWQRLTSQLSLRLTPFKEFLQINGTAGVNYYNSHGNTYRHEYTNWFGRVNANLFYKKWMLGFVWETNWNWFWGETMSGGENIHILMLKYTHKNMSVTAGMFNPFVDNYKQEYENRSRYASYRRANHIDDSSRLFIMQFTYNFSFGRKFSVGQKRLNNSDDDSGVMSTGK